MKPTKPKKKRAVPARKKKPPTQKPPTLPVFIATTQDAEFPINVRLAKYGRKIGPRPDVIRLFESINLWREGLPASLAALKKGGFSDEEIERSRTNAAQRTYWSEHFENAIVDGDAEFFDTLAALIRQKKSGSGYAHLAEFHTWNEAFRLLWATGRCAPKGKDYVWDWPTKGQVKRAVEAKGVQISKEQFARVLRRLHLHWLPKDKSGPKQRHIRIR